MKKLLPLLLALIGTGAGIGAGLFLAPSPDSGAEHASAEPGTAQDGGHPAEPAAGSGDHTAADQGASEHGGSEHGEGESGTEYVKLNNQFVVPVVEDSRVAALVVLSISLEVAAGSAAATFEEEPKLRDGFLRTLFDHANIGGFDGNFTETPRMDALRRVLFETARNILGARVRDVLITDIARQDN
ncbi:flagellar basal body-associated FliL family protein [Salipiger sp. H15]|uniref:Flagellar protein FliL n=1 Tax=Alloyangia sp. H15 TaxID=3029062 RepID=A0AAU8AJ07_9RHOB